MHFRVAVRHGEVGAGGRATVRTLAFQRSVLRPEEEFYRARHELEELRPAYDDLRVELASFRPEEAAYWNVRDFHDGPGGYGPHYCHKRPPS